MRVRLCFSFCTSFLNFSRQITKGWHNRSWKLRLHHLENKLPGTSGSIDEAVPPLLRLDNGKDARVQMKQGLVSWWKTCVSLAAVETCLAFYQSRTARLNLSSHRSDIWLQKLTRLNDLVIAYALSRANLGQNEAINRIPIDSMLNGLWLWHR